jgi:cytochrome c-type biogenesis protein CcmH
VIRQLARLVLVAAVLTLSAVVASPALASEERPTLGELESEVMCPTCKSTLAMSNSPIADRIRDFIARRIQAGDSKSEIKQQLVDEFGPAVLAEPSKKGFNLLAWVLPLVGIVLGAIAVGGVAWKWTRGRAGGEGSSGTGGTGGGPAGALDADIERRLDEELARYKA